MSLRSPHTLTVGARRLALAAAAVVLVVGLAAGWGWLSWWSAATALGGAAGLVIVLTRPRLGAFAIVVLRLGRRLDTAHVARVGAEERARLTQSLARSVTESAHDAIVVADGEGAITLFNPGAERLFGWQADEVRGRPVTLLMPERYRAGHRAGLARVALGGPAMLAGKTIERHGLTKAGREFDLELSLSPVHDAGGVHITAIMRDISPRKLLEQIAREETERMARVAKAQTRIAAGGGDLVETMQLVAAHSAAILGAAGAVVELPDGEDLVYRAGVGQGAGQRGLRVSLDGSLSGRCLRDGATLNCADTETDDRVDRDACRRVGARSMLCVPLRHRDVPIGVLKVTSGRPGAFGPREERTVELLGAIGAAAVHRALVERRLAAHHATGQALAVARSLEAGLAGALRGIGDRLDWDLGAIWLADDDLGDLRCIETWAAASLAAAPYLELVGAPTPPDAESLVAVARRDASAVWVESAAGGTDPSRAAAAAACGLRTLVAVPIVSRDEVLGVLELGSRDVRTHDTTTLDLLAGLAGQLAQFVKRRRAEERMALQARNLAAVAELSQELSRSHEPSEARATLCRAVRDLSHCPQVVLLEPDGAGRLVVTGQAGDFVALGVSLDLERDTALTIDVFRSGTGAFIRDVLDEARADPRLRPPGLRSLHIEPLKRDGQVVGIIAVASDRLRSRDAGGLGELMRLLAAEAATALTLADLLATLRERAHTDELTGLANRRTLDAELPRELARASRSGTPLSMAMLDLDRFKAYNDTFGHPAGDRLLRATAAAWAGRLRSTDVLARYGGEEFAVLLPDCDADAGARVAEALRAAMPDGATCSIGLATWDGHESPDALVARADAALYAAKGAGRDRVVAAA